MKKINCFLVLFLLSILITGCSANNKIEISDGVNVEFVDALFLKHPEEPSENRIVTILKASNETKEIQDVAKISDIYFENCYLTIDDLEVDSSLDDVTGISSDVEDSTGSTKELLDTGDSSVYFNNKKIDRASVIAKAY